LVVFLSTADFINSLLFLLGNFIPEYKAPQYCVIIGAIRTFFFLSTFPWTSVVAWRLYQICRGWYNEKTAFQQDRLFHCICWGLPSFYVAIMLIIHSTKSYDFFGPDNFSFCWIQNERVELPAFGGPFIIALLFNTTLYTLILMELRHSISKNLAVVRRLTLLPAVFVLANLPLLIRDIWLYYVIPPLWVEFVYVFFFCSQGLMNAIVYGFNPQVFKAYKSMIGFNSLSINSDENTSLNGAENSYDRNISNNNAANNAPF